MDDFYLKYSEKQRKIMAIVVVALVLIGTIAFLLINAAMQDQCTATTTATVIGSRMQVKSQHSYTNGYFLRCEYVVDGVKYDGYEIRSHTDHSDNLITTVDGLGIRNKQVIIRYNPNNPSQFVVDDQSLRQAISGSTITP